MDHLEPLMDLVDDLRQLLPDAPPMGAFAMGLAAGAGLHTGRRPSRALLERARACVSLGEAARLIEGDKLSASSREWGS